MKKSAKIFLFIIAGLTLISLPLSVLAAGQYNQPATVTADQIIDGNYIKAASVINIAGSVKGDVIVAGQSITISGQIAGDVIAVGSSVKITGPVSGSVRVIASSVEINNVVERNAWVVASTVNFGDQTAVGWDIYGAAGTLAVKGKVDGNITVAAGTAMLGTQVGKNVDLTLGRKGTAVLLPEAKVSGNLTYHAASDSQLTIQPGAAVSGQTKREAVKMSEQFDFKSTLVNTVFFNIISFFSLLVLGLVLITFFPKIAFNAQEEMVSRPWPSLGKGFLFLAAIPLAVVLLIFTIIGLPLALIIAALFLIELYLCKVFAAFTIGLLAVNYFSGNRKYGGSLIWPLALGLFVVLALTAIPLIGFVAKILLTVWAFGALLAVQKGLWRELR